MYIYTRENQLLPLNQYGVRNLSYAHNLFMYTNMNQLTNFIKKFSKIIYLFSIVLYYIYPRIIVFLPFLFYPNKIIFVIRRKPYNQLYEDIIYAFRPSIFLSPSASTSSFYFMHVGLLWSFECTTSMYFREVQLLQDGGSTYL